MTTLTIPAAIGMLALASAALAASPLPKDKPAMPVANDYSAQLKALSASYAGGDQSAGIKLAELLFNGPELMRDRKKACNIAYTLSEMQNPKAYPLRATCIRAGMEAGEDRFGKARAFARRAMAGGDAAGAYLLYTLFAEDPKYQYTTDGKFDEAKYKALAAMPASARPEQIEAIDALAFAAAKGHQAAVQSAITYLAENSAPGNSGRLLNLAATMGAQQAAVRNQLMAAQQAKGFGSSHASTKAFSEALKSATAASITRYRQIYGEECRDAKLRSTSAGTLRDAEYLPLKNETLRNSYLLKGEWDETWQFSVCSKEILQVVSFSADGWGGARFKLSLPADRQ